MADTKKPLVTAAAREETQLRFRAHTEVLRDLFKGRVDAKLEELKQKPEDTNG